MTTKYPLPPTQLLNTYLYHLSLVRPAILHSNLTERQGSNLNLCSWGSVFVITPFTYELGDVNVSISFSIKNPILSEPFSPILWSHAQILRQRCMSEASGIYLSS